MFGLFLGLMKDSVIQQCGKLTEAIRKAAVYGSGFASSDKG
jgi:hypothetical protein